MKSRPKLLTVAGCCLVAAQAHGQSAQPQGEWPDYQLTMTWVSGDNRYAAIDGEFYSVGDVMPDGTKVLAVESGIVRVERDGVADYVRIVDSPPSPDERPPQPRAPADSISSYLEYAVAELDRALDAGARRDDRQRDSARLQQLRDRLAAARDRLNSEDLSEAERQRIEARFDRDWLAAQQRLDDLRRRIDTPGGGQGTDDLVATRRLLEESTLAAVRQPLARLLEQASGDTPSGDAPEAAQSSDLLEMAVELLGSYPDYQRLAEQLGQLQAEKERQ